MLDDFFTLLNRLVCFRPGASHCALTIGMYQLKPYQQPRRGGLVFYPPAADFSF
jgi:hypothetical protein